MFIFKFIFSVITKITKITVVKTGNVLHPKYTSQIPGICLCKFAIHREAKIMTQNNNYIYTANNPFISYNVLSC